MNTYLRVIKSFGITAVVLIATVSSTSTSVFASSSQSSASSSTKIQPCIGNAQVRPKSYVISCADANTEVSALHWAAWTKTGAHATGKYNFNTCTPSCVAGKSISDTASIVLSSPKNSGSGRVFSQMLVKYQSSKKKITSVRISLPLKPY